MATCKFSHLVIGEAYNINITGGECLACHQPFEADHIDATYVGHRTDGGVYDAFQLSIPLTCSGCGQEIFYHGVPCELGGSWSENELVAAAKEATP